MFTELTGRILIERTTTLLSLHLCYPLCDYIFKQDGEIKKSKKIRECDNLPVLSDDGNEVNASMKFLHFICM